MLSPLSLICTSFFVLEIISASDIRLRQTPTPVSAKKKREDTSTVTIENASPLNYTASLTGSASVPTGSDVVVQNITDGAVFEFSDELRNALNETLKDNCNDLWSPECHTALQEQFQNNQTDTPHAARGLTLWHNNPEKRQHSPANPQGGNDLGAAVLTSAVGTVGAAALLGVSAPVIAIALAGFLCIYLVGSAVIDNSGSTTSQKATLDLPERLQISQANLDALKQDPNATAIEFDTKKEKPLVLEDQNGSGQADTGDQGTGLDQGNSTDPDTFIQAETNGDFTINLSRALASTIEDIFAKQAKNCTTFSHKKRKAVGTKFKLRDATGPYPPEVQTCIVAGMSVLALNTNEKVLKPLYQMKIKPALPSKPLPPTLPRPGKAGVQTIFTQAFAGISSAIAVISQALIATTKDSNAAENAMYYITQQRVVSDSAVGTKTKVPTADQDSGSQKNCPFLLRCENKGCLSSQGVKTRNEICPPDANVFPNCFCNDCADDEYMPACDNCGGIQPGTDTGDGKEVYDDGIPETDGKKPGNQKRVIPGNDPGPRCVGFPDQGWAGCKCYKADNPPGLQYYGSEEEFNAAQSALLNLPLLSSMSDAPAATPTPSSSSAETVATSSPTAPDPTKCPDPLKDPSDKDGLQSWRDLTKNKCNNCPMTATGQFNDCDGGTHLCSCIDPICQNAKCYLDTIPTCSKKAPDSNDHNGLAAWYDDNNNNCVQCAVTSGGKYTQCQNILDENYQHCKCAASVCPDADCYLSAPTFCPAQMPRTNQPVQWKSWSKHAQANSCDNCPGGRNSTYNPDQHNGVNLAICKEGICAKSNCIMT